MPPRRSPILDPASRTYRQTLARLFQEAAATSPIPPSQVAKILTAHGIRHVFIGGLVVGCHSGRPRATRDVDVIVDPESTPLPAVRVIAKLLPKLRVTRHPSFISISQKTTLGEQEVVDLITSSAGSYAQAFDFNLALDVGGQPIMIPTAELLVVLKYTAAINPVRSVERKAQDWADIAAISAANPKLRIAACMVMANRVLPGLGEDLKQRLRDRRFG